MVEAVRGQFDREGRLVGADGRLLALNARAGGQLGAPLAMPQLATVIRLARTLSVPIARSVLMADGDRDWRASASIKVAGDGLELTLSEWAEQAPRPSWLIPKSAAALAGLPAADWTWATDAMFALTHVELTPEERSEFRLDELLGRPLTKLVRLIEDDAGALPILAAAIAHADFAGQRAVRRDRSDVEYVLSARALHTPEGRFVGYAGSATVAPPPVAAADDAVVVPFPDRLGTTLRGPLDRIVARAESISAQSDGPLRRDYADYAGDIASAGRHLLALVDDLADLHAVERPGFTIAVEPVDLADLARRAAGLLSVRASVRRVRIDRPGVDEMLMASGDFRRVLQILVNLVGNAVRYSPEGGMVWLRIESDDDTAVVVVADQGRGIDVADQARIFEKFERVDQSEAEGSGLGLYISRRLALAMGGDITVDSAPGQGARFTLTLPTSI